MSHETVQLQAFVNTVMNIYLTTVFKSKEQNHHMLQEYSDYGLN
jgi:hypothetical protein